MFLFALAGCTANRQEMPPLPKGFTPKPALFTDEPIPLPIMPRIGLAWSNHPPPAADGSYVTGLEASTNLIHWFTLSRMPYTNAGEYFLYLTNRPPHEFYRAFNAQSKP